MFVEREASVTTSASNDTSELNRRGTGLGYHGNCIDDDGKSRITRLVKERVLAELRARPVTNNNMISTMSSSGSIGGDNKSLSIQTRGKSISSRCKSTTSMDSGYYSEPRIHTPKMSTDSHLIKRKDKSKPPLAKAVLEFMVAKHPDNFKDAKMTERVRNATTVVYDHQSSQKGVVDNDLKFQARVNLEQSEASDSFALPELEHLISGWEAKIHADPGRESAKAKRPGTESPCLMSLDRQVPIWTTQLELREPGRKYPQDSRTQLSEKKDEDIKLGKSYSQGTLNKKLRSLTPTPFINTYSASPEMSDTSIPDYGLFEATEAEASDLESNFQSELEFCPTPSVDGPELSEDNSTKDSPVHLGAFEHDSSEYTNFETILGFVSNAIKDPLLQKLLEHALSEATDASENSGPSSRSSSTRSQNTAPTSQSSHSSMVTNNFKRNRGRGGSDPDDDDNSDEEDSDDGRPKKKPAPGRVPQRRLKCPFYQREPDKYTKAACRGDGFTEMGKLKDHLKRVHTQPLRCPRCYIDVDSIEERDEHLSQDLVCEKRPKPYDERIQPQVLRRLDFKRLPFSNARDMGEKWRIMYKILFPGGSDADIPSPYDRNALSPGMATALSEALEEELTMELAPILAPIMARIKERIPAIIHRCRVKLAKHAATKDEMGSASCIAHSDTGSNTPDQPTRLRKKKRISPLSQRGCDSFGFIPRYLETNSGTSVAQTSIIPSYLTALPGKGYMSASKLSRPSSVDHTFGMESFHTTRYPEASAHVSMIGDWDVYDPGLLECSPGCDEMLLNKSFETRAIRFDAQNPEMQSSHIELYEYSGGDMLNGNTWNSSANIPDIFAGEKRVPGQGPGTTGVANQSQSFRP